MESVFFNDNRPVYQRLLIFNKLSLYK